MLAVFGSGGKLAEGSRFLVPSPGWWARTVVRQKLLPGQGHYYEYEVTHRLQEDDDLLAMAKFTEQKSGGPTRQEPEGDSPP